MRGKISLKIVVMLQMVFGVALILTALLSYFKFEKAVTNVIASRFDVIVNGLQGDIENTLNLGFSLAELRDLQQLIIRESSRDDQILSIDVVDADGAVLFASRAERVGKAIPPEWVRTMTRTEIGIWRETEGGEPVLGATLRNTYGQVAGGVTLRYSRAAIRQRTEAVQPGLLLAGGASFVIGFALTALGGWLVFRNFVGTLRQGEAFVAEALAGIDGATADPPAHLHAPPPGALGHDLDRIVAKLQAASTDLDRTDAALGGGSRRSDGGDHEQADTRS